MIKSRNISGRRIPANYNGSALWTDITVVGSEAVTGNVYVAEEPEHFEYDADGNLTNDGRWSYVWDAENRLIQMTVNTNVGPQYQLQFAYDPKGRRIEKIVLTNGVAYYTNDFLYDGWKLKDTESHPQDIKNDAVSMARNCICAPFSTDTSECERKWTKRLEAVFGPDPVHK